MLALLAALPVTAGQAVAGKAKPPETRRNNVKEVLHGVEITDPYRWLEDQQSPETRAWIGEQNKYTDSLLDPLPGRDRIEQRLIELMKIDSVGVPRERNGRYFFAKRLAEQDLSVIYMRKGITGEDEVLIDPHPMSADYTTSVTLIGASSDGQTLIYGVREGGEDEITVHLMDVDTRQDWADTLPKARYFAFNGGVALTPDKRGLYYARLNPEGPRVYYHAIGTDPAQDRKIFGDGYGPGKLILSRLSEDGRYLLIHVLHGSAAAKTEIYYQDLKAQGPLTPIVNDIPARFFGQIGGDQLFMQTNWQAPNNRILAVDLKNPGREHWRELVPEDEQAVIEGLSLAGGKLFVEYLRNVRSLIKVFDAEGRPVRTITFPALGSVSGLSGHWESPEAFFAFSSFHLPTTIYRYDAASGKQTVWARLPVQVESDTMALRQVWYESKDGTLVPMFLLHRKGIALDGSNPTLLTGYGGFTISLTPRFSSTAVLWVERGGVVAMPNLRGGGEFGEEWHRAGMRGNKQNVFDDFIAAAGWLVENGYT
ncbi:MAG: prolyl oligopeptidase family protein, partial [Terriglobia bacterium]